MRPTRLFLILVLSLVTVEYGGRVLGVRAGLHHFAECPKGPAWDRSGERGQAGWDDHAAYMRVVAQEELVVPGGRSARPFGAAVQRLPAIVRGEDSGVHLDQGWSLRS